MFGQDGDAVGEFRGFNFVYHPSGDQKETQYCTAVEKGSSNPSTAQKWRQTRRKPAVFTPIYLTAVRPWQRIMGCLWVPVKSPRLNQFWPVHSFQRNLVAEVFA